MQTICVYCASSTQIPTVYFEAARELGNLLAAAGVRLVYGGGATGLMGELADTMLHRGAVVTGVIPQFMCDENWHHEAVSELIVVETMHERKERMAQMADAVVALPGGCGTFEELLEAITWKQLGIITSPIVILNTNGYYDPMVEMLHRAVDQNFMREIHKNIWTVVSSPSEVLAAVNQSLGWDSSIRKMAAI